MNNQKISYADTCVITNHKGVKVTGDILDFRPEKLLVVSLDKSVKISLIYNSKLDLYRGSMAGIEFTSSGPEETISYQGRK